MSVQIHVWSDYVCPFCLIADELLERALSDRPDVKVVHRPFELRPHPTPTLRPEDPYLPGIWQIGVYPMARRYEVPLSLPSISPQPYTELAFRGAQYAAGQGLAQAYHRRMLTAFFRENLDIGDRAVLARLAGEIGLDRAAYTAALDDQEYADRHRHALAVSARAGITVVPTIIVAPRRTKGLATRRIEGAPRRAGRVPHRREAGGVPRRRVEGGARRIEGVASEGVIRRALAEAAAA
ncbi:DsbA family oxidoreductase [Kribbella deserti]|uniref:DsbA family protein n=1 Tax=Kribbella deserti TaxID=1926257 RepID=A0ABV6QRC2_9ACTN